MIDLLFVPFVIFFLYTDIKKRVVPDKAIILGLTLSFLLSVYKMAERHSFYPFVEYAAGFFICALPLFIVIMVTKGGMGAGDMKLIGLIGSWFGYKRGLFALFAGIILAGFTAVFLVILKKANRRTELPFAPFILAGLVLTIIFERRIAEFFMYYYLIDF